MVKEKAMLFETSYDRDVRCGYTHRDPMVVDAMQIAKAAAFCAAAALVLAGISIWLHIAA